jgi:threonine/homoserine/homoserine lactone efflux protein
MSGVDLIPFAIFAAAMIGTPGPANMVLLTAGARFGLRRALPFVLGVALGKQLVIWPMGFGLLALIAELPWLFVTLKYVSVAYILFLAWRIAGARIAPGAAPASPPPLAEGLIVHPLNPKAWALISTGFTSYVAPGTPALTATLAIAACLFAVQIVAHPLWCWGGERLAAAISGKRAERLLMIALAGLTVASVLLVLLRGESA